MKVIGITGGVGTGKSTVLSILKEEYNATIIEADKVAHQLMMPGGATYQPIIEAFGQEILETDGGISRVKLGAIVFSDAEKLNQLNGITHPAVKDFIVNIIEREAARGQDAFVVIEAALLIETGYQDICDEIWYIYSDENVRIQRLMASRGYSKEKCISIMKNQSNEVFYRENCQQVIDNSGDFIYTKQQIDNLLKK